MIRPLVKYLAVIFYCIVTSSYSHAETTDVEISHITPQEGSSGGATRLTIYGGDFASSEFNHGAGNEGVGNTVDLVSLTRSYPCEVHKDGTTEKQIMCITPARMKEDDYYIKVKVDGEDVPKDEHCRYWRDSKCRFKISNQYTPSITSIAPQSGPPDSTVVVKGRLFSDRRGSHIATSSNGKTEKFLRIYVGGYECDLLVDPNDDKLFLVKLDNSESNDGEFTCKIKSEYVTNQNVSFIIEGKYGRSRPDVDILRVSGNNKIYTFQSYAEISSVSPKSFSEAGGATLTITGKYFDDTISPVEVSVGGENCIVTSSTSTEIRCTTPVQPPAVDVYSGNRGVDVEVWIDPNAADLEDVVNLGTSNNVTHTEDFLFNIPAGQTARVRSVFMPPSDNTYQFEIKNTGVTSKLFFSDNSTVKTIIATSGTRTSAVFSLEKGNRYFLDFVGETASDLKAQVGVCVFDTDITSGMTGASKAERQKIAVRSTVKQEIQTLTLSDFTAVSGTPEVQRVDVLYTDSSLDGATYRLGLDNIYTVPLAGDADEAGVANALLALPGVLANSVTVTRSSISGGLRYTITFVAGLGNVDLLTVKTEANDRGENLAVTVQETTSGVPSLEYFRLALDNIKSAPIAADASASQAQSSVWNMFEERCPQSIDDPSGSAFVQGYESSRTYRVMQIDEKDDGTIIRAFCGKSFWKNPGYFYQTNEKGIYLSQYKTVCFAYLGGIQSKLYIYYTYKDAQFEDRSTGTWFEVSEIVATTSWRYICVDVMALISTRITGGSQFYLQRLLLARQTDEDIYLDSVYVGRTPTTTDFTGLNEGWTKRRQAIPSGHMINDVEVTSSGTSYTLTLTPNECGSDFKIFDVVGGQVTSGSNSQSSQSVVYSYGGGTVSVNVDEEASPPVTGDFVLVFDNKTKTVPVKSTAEELQNILQSIGATGTVVTRGDNCASFDWFVTWSGKGGNQPELEIPSESLSGIDATIAASTLGHGMLCYDPIPAEFLRTVHDVPQVSANINGISTACTGSCDLEWSASSTPTITAVTPQSGTLSQGTTITITGTKFSTISSDNTVMIGGINCTLQSATATSITCDVGNGPKGSFHVDVTVSGLGLASHPDPAITFTYVAEVSSISPTSGSTEGGTHLTIVGYGFASGANVTVDGLNCLVTSSIPSEIECVTPRSATRADSGVDVIVSQDGYSMTSQTFNYRISDTASITAISPTTSSVEGDVTITITGSGFGGSQPSDDALMIGNAPATIIEYNDTLVTAVLPGQAPGSYPVRLMTSSTGFADTRENNISEISYVFEVTNMFPRTGSLYGGTRLTITGRGFSTEPGNNIVMIGSQHCEVENSTDVQIVCKIEKITKKHLITNKGQSIAYGSGFAWDKSSVTVEVGDTVRWEWTSDPSLELTYRVQRTASLAATEYDDTGFNSGSAGSASGAYEYQFTETGTNSYWSGYVREDPMIALRGEVNVVARQSFVGYLKVTRGMYEAYYSTSSGVSDPSGGYCPGDTTAISGCSTPKPTASDSSKFGFAFWECSTPMVDQIAPVQATGDVDIVITGSGFTSTKCENEVYIGGYQCLISSSSPTQITAKVDPAKEVPVGKILPITVWVGNRGNAPIKPLKDADRSFVSLPFVSGFSPTTGSLAGGTQLMISGGGFSSDAKVTVGGFVCDISSVEYSSITCTTGALSGSVDLVVKSRVDNGQLIDAECSQSVTCVFTYTSQDTPTVTSVTPTEVDAPGSILTLAGTGFGTDLSKVTVSLGSGGCTIGSLSDIEIVCNTLNVPGGSHDVQVSVSGKGLAHSSGVTLSNKAKLSSVSPSAGSIHGGTWITIAGNGFTDGVTTVMIDSDSCDTESVTPGQIVCRTPAHAAGSVNLEVTSANLAFTPAQTFTYSTAQTPEITAISPTESLAGDTLDISGTNLTGNMTITIDGVDCTVTSTSPLQCTLGAHSAGEYPVVLHVEGMGYANTDKMFNYAISVSSVSPSSGSFAGGQQVTVSGSGFDPDYSVVQICNKTCALVQDVTQSSSALICIVPSSLDGATLTNQTCDVTVGVNNVEKRLSDGFTYDPNLTPSITGVTPGRGGTAGGTSVTITGQGFSSTNADNSVSIGGVTCDVTSASSIQIVCTTEASNTTQETTVSVFIEGKGEAIQTSADYHYVDVWSSQWTWGGKSPPAEGELVIISKGQTILLDTDTPVLKMILIQGGKLIFDEVDVELQAEIILITDGGVLQVGTEAEPFQHKAIITLHGHLRSKELPIYGTKNIAVREGILDLHGKIVSMTWTYLESTANSGQNSITLVNPVDWSVGDTIVIATTGDRHSQSENEVHVISAISGNGKTLTLQSALSHTHLGVSETFDGREVEFRAEVGLLTRNVVVRGSADAAWNDVIPACEDGFDTGEFSTQTCFQGRFGEETGSDKFGAQIIFHAPKPNKNLVIGRLEYIEVTNAGQAFRLGRYPVHFHLNGQMTGSYVRGLGIHKTFNRAVNIHGTHNVLVEHTVIYNIMGGAFFLEDGVETGNTFQYNLAVFVISSTSLLNDDITPAAYWVTNPNNTVSHNTAVGGTHFGFWYRMHEHPDGPSFDPNICPKKVPLGIFENNTVHSQGWFGIWIFEDYFPMAGGGCGSNTPIAAVFKGLTVWNCEKGAEFVNGGSIQFDDAILANNQLAGLEGKLVKHAEEFTENGPLIKNSMIVARTSELTTSMGPTKGGVILPYGQGYAVKNVTFVNFNQNNSAAFKFTRIDGTCSHRCGGFTYHTGGIKKVNSPNLGIYAWTHEGLIKDTDGSLTGKIGGCVTPTVGTLPLSKCSSLAGFSVGIPASVCDSDVNFLRFSFNKITPESLLAKQALFTNSHGNDTVSFNDKRITHKAGWMTTLVSGQEYDLVFINGEVMVNISYSSRFDLQQATDYVVLSQSLPYFPDRFSISNNNFINESNTESLTVPANSHGDWIFDNNNNQIKFLISGHGDTSPPTIYKPVHLQAYRCYYPNCEPPPDPNTVPPANARPRDFVYWSNTETWRDTPSGWGGNFGNGNYGLPKDGDDVVIGEGSWVVADVVLPRMNKLYLYGTLELDGDFNATSGTYRDFVLSAEYIYIVGGRLIVGWPDNSFKGEAEIILRGNHSSPRLDVLGGPEVGAKAIGAFGGLDLHGKEVSTPWTTLSTTAEVGATTLTLAISVDWAVGDEIVLTPTGYDPWETETFKLVSVSGTQIGLNASVQYKHLAFTETVGSQTYKLTAEVGLLTRNVKVTGEDYDDLYSESFGTRVIVGLISDGDTSYLGYARISNVEFYHTGQEGFRDAYDPRHSVSYRDCGPVSAKRPSFVKNNAFHNGFSTAVGVYNTHGLEISNNVIHRTVGAGVEVLGDAVNVNGNLVTLSIFPGTYHGRLETKNIEYAGAIDGRKSTNLSLTGNAVSGSERMAYRVPGESCNSPSQWSGNVARTSLIGVGFLPGDGFPSCLKIAGFEISMCPDFGIYLNSESSAMFADLTLVGNMLGIFPMVIGPSAKSRLTADKTVSVTDSLIVGTPSSFDCNNNIIPTATFVSAYGHARSNIFGNGRKAGLTWPSFTQSSNNAPEKPFKDVMDYNSINGVMFAHNVTFAHFAEACGRKDIAIATNPSNDDGQHPIESRDLQFFDTPTKNKVFIRRPNVGKINPADCVDMDCDAMKKAIINDKDGSLLGSPGTVISQSEYEWDGDARRGLGDYRIPKTLLSTTSGTRIPVADIAPNKGIYRTPSCQYVPDWQAHSCPNQDYRMLIIESLDSDTETRRLSPVAVLVDGYIDLINGPQDHGWCSGYTCQERLSTFMSVVPTGKEAKVYFTSTSPQNLRLHLLNSDASDAVLISIWYAEPFRLDVYYQGNHILPTDGYLDSDGEYQIRTEDKLATGKPQMSAATGTNFMDRETNLLYILVKGRVPVDIRTSPVIVVVFEASSEFVTVDEFFGANLVNNLVAFLGVDSSKVRVVDVVRENSSRRKKRQASGTVQFYIEVGNEPVSSVNASVNNSLSFTELTNYTSYLVNAALLGTLDLNTTMYVIEPIPSSNDPAWGYRIVANETIPRTLIRIEPIDRMAFDLDPVAMEGKPFTVAPKLKILNSLGARVSHIGTSLSPWEVEVTMRTTSESYISGALLGNTTLQFTDGWAEFGDLILSHAGTYILEFRVTSPPEAANFTLEKTILVARRPLVANILTFTDTVVENTTVQFVLDVRDEQTQEKIDDLSWRGHTWTVHADLPKPELYWGQMTGTPNATFNPATSEVTFPDLTFSSLGLYFVRFRVISNPPEYDFYVLGGIKVITPNQLNIVRSQNTTVEVKFDANYNDVIASAEDMNYFSAYLGNFFRQKYHAVLIEDTTIRPGSILVSFTISGNASDVRSVVYSACDEIATQSTFNFNGQTLSMSSYFKVDGQHYYGTKCGPQDQTVAPKDDYRLHPGVIAAIVLVCLLSVILVGAVIFWKFTVLPKTKTNDNVNGIKHIGSTNSSETILFRENTFESLRERGELPVNPAAPTSTTYLRPSPRHTPTGDNLLENVALR